MEDPSLKHPVKQTTERRISATLRLAMVAALLLMNLVAVSTLTDRKSVV